MTLKNINKIVWSWSLYDFANSAYSTSVLSVIFNIYFVSVLIPEEGLSVLGRLVPGASVWSYLISAVMCSVLLVSPFLGALSDTRGLKRFFLVFFGCLGAFSTLALAFLTPTHPWQAILFTFVATLAFEMSLVFYNAFLIDISSQDTAGRVSGLGFALGYIGGGLCLALNIWALKAGYSVQVCMGMVAAWWLVFSLPAYFVLRDAPTALVPGNGHVLNQLKATWKYIGRNRSLKRFLLAYLVYEDGIITVVIMASIFGAKALGMSSSELAVCYLMVQFVAFAGAFVCGRWADSWNHKGVVLVSLGVYTATVVWAVFLKNTWEFWILAFVVGLVLGGSQAASRSLFSLMIPQSRAGEFFSFFSIVGKAASMFGPFMFGFVNQVAGLRAGVASLLIFFVVGGALLLGVTEEQGQKEVEFDAYAT